MCYDGPGFYLAEFPFSSDHGDVERTIIEIDADGLVHTTADADGPLPIELSDYVPIQKLPLWPTRLAA